MKLLALSSLVVAFALFVIATILAIIAMRCLGTGIEDAKHSLISVANSIR